MGEFIAAGIKDDMPGDNAWNVAICTGDDTDLAGDSFQWIWANPSNRKYSHRYHGCTAVSVAALWQGTKVHGPVSGPDELAMAGDWRRGHGRVPRGAWAGPAADLIEDVGAARRAIYLPAYRYQVMSWVVGSEEVQQLVQAARDHDGPVYLRDREVFAGVDNPTGMSAAWLLATWLNTGSWPQ